MIAFRSAPALCARCGLPGPHSDALECIDALRDRLADLEFQIDGRRSGADTARRGGRRERKDARMVILDGRRLCLTEAARELGISAVALHFRLVNRTGTADYREIDIRVVGADRPRRGA